MAKLADFLETDAAKGFHVGGTEAGIDCLMQVAKGGSVVRYVSDRLADGATRAEIMAELDGAADYAGEFEANVRLFMKRSFEHSGDIEATRKAIDEFCRTQTKANLDKVAEASKSMTGYRIPMDRVTQKRFSKFVKPGLKCEIIDYGSVHVIASGHYDASKVTRATT